MRVDDQREARSSTFRTQLLLEPRVQVTIRLERCKPFVCCWEGAAAPARRQRSPRHPGLLVMRRVRHEAGGYPEVGVSSPAQGAAMGCTAVQPSHTSSEVDIGGSTSRGAAATQRPGRSRREATLDMHTCWGPAQERQRSLGLWGASQPPPATWLAAAELQMTAWSASARRRRRLLRSGNVETHTSGCRSW